MVGWFKKVLVANRGEIACRVLGTAKKLGIQTVAIYSEADRNSWHVKQADESYCVGPAASTQSYLRKDRVIDVALKSGAQAIHPGYGFLSENSEFAEMCEQAGITFIGPPGSAIRAMGSKSESKRIMVDAGVPVVPGYHKEDQEVNILMQEADKIGYPLIIKAVMGGGGKGMKIVRHKDEFLQQLESARREAKSGFGDDRVILERYITKPKHIEVQVFCDSHGNALHLYERDCSIQRRHQKVIEESPSELTLSQKHTIGETAKQAALAVGYRGAGTVEFIYDEETGKHYFMEMNTRLQVEHPVTEMVTGLDLVELQFLVASGHVLPLKQDEVKLNGHAIEARIYSEDPSNNFLPCGGKLLYLKSPTTDKNVRVDSGVQQGDEIGIFYDPMISKLIVWGENRETAVNRMRYALSNYIVCGLPTNIPFLRNLMDNSQFRQGKFNTNFIAEHKESLLVFPELGNKGLAAAAVCISLQDLHQAHTDAKRISKNQSPWFTLDNFRVNDTYKRTLKFKQGEVQLEQRDTYTLTVNGEIFKYSGKFTGDYTYLLESEAGIESWKLIPDGKLLWLVSPHNQIFQLVISM